jgi:hypothetical protein
VGHRAMLKGDTRNELRVGDGSWIGQDCYFHSAGGIRIGRDVGIAPRAMILTSSHEETRLPRTRARRDRRRLRRRPRGDPSARHEARRGGARRRGGGREGRVPGRRRAGGRAGAPAAEPRRLLEFRR